MRATGVLCVCLCPTAVAYSMYVPQQATDTRVRPGVTVVCCNIGHSPNTQYLYLHGSRNRFTSETETVIGTVYNGRFASDATTWIRKWFKICTRWGFYCRKL